MRKDKEYILELRREGKTYREIERQTGVSRATLSVWFRDLPWSKHLSAEHQSKNLGASKERMERMNMVRKLKLQYQYALLESEAEKEYRTFKKDPLFWAGLMIYAGEGDRRDKSLIRISNSEEYLHRIFIAFCLRYLEITREKIRIGLLVYPDHAIDVCRQYWSDSLHIPLIQFHKTQILQGKEKEKRLQYGVGMSIITNTGQKKKLMKWLFLAQSEQFNIDAIIV